MAKKKKKIKNIVKDQVLIKDSRIKGYVKVHISYLISKLNWIKENSTLKEDVLLSEKRSVFMIAHLLRWMGERKSHPMRFWEKTENLTQWIDLKEDHWIVDHEVRDYWLKRKMI